MKKFILSLILSFSPLFALEETALNEIIQGPSVQDFNRSMQDAMIAHNWWRAIDMAEIISENYSSTPFAGEATFVTGEAYYKLDQLEYANNAFTDYLNLIGSPKHFEEAIHYKFMIAEQFAQGAKKRLFGSPKMPAWIPAQEDAIPIYEEVIAALPHSEVAAKALLSKARLEASFEEYKTSIETLELLIRKFPKHSLAAESYLEKNKVYLAQCKEQSADPALLDLAEINLRKFRLAFPRESRIEEATKLYREIEEIFAANLLEVGQFYQKTKKHLASQIYYNKVMTKYPNTKAAASACEKLKQLPLPRTVSSK